MNFLAIDCSGAHLTVAVVKDDKVYEYYKSDCGVKHSVSLMPEVERLLNESALSLKTADFVAVAAGAGSFTGIRIGVATAKALAFANGIPCLSVTSFDTLAYNVKGGRVLAVIDAGHGGYYACGYEDYKVVFPPKYILKEELMSLSSEYRLVAGGELSGFNAEIAKVNEGLIAAVKAKAAEATFDYDSIVPLYVRKSQAEEGR